MSKTKPYIDTENLTQALFYKPGTTLDIYIPKLSSPIPKDSDYKRGYFYRYFCRIINNKDAQVNEISKDEYNTVNSKFLYKTLKIKWKLVGSKDIAAEINTKIIETSDKILPGIKSILLEPLQYWKNLPDTVPQFDATNKLPKTEVKKKWYNLNLIVEVSYTERGLIFVLTESNEVIFIEDGITGIIIEG